MFTATNGMIDSDNVDGDVFSCQDPKKLRQTQLMMLIAGFRSVVQKKRIRLMYHRSPIVRHRI